MTTPAQRPSVRPSLAWVATAAVSLAVLVLGGCTSDHAAGPSPSVSLSPVAAASSVGDDLSPERPRDSPGDGSTDDTQAVTTVAEAAAVRQDPSRVGAVRTARTFVVAWLRGFVSDDTAVFDLLRLPECTFCTTMRAAFTTSSTRQAVSTELSLDTMPLDVTGPTDADPTTVVTIGGRRSFTAYVTTDNVTHVQVSDPKDFRLVVGLTRTEAGWAVREAQEVGWTAPAEW